MYINGNYIVNVLRFDGRSKRTLRVGENFEPQFPDSIDLKITNRCSIGCPWCHESSEPGGGIFDFTKTTNILSSLPRVPLEIAIGGGDVLECPEEAIELVKWIKDYGFHPRLTVNIESLKKIDWEKSEDPRIKLLDYVSTIGISVRSPSIPDNLFASRRFRLTKVFHVILGIMPISDFDKLVSKVSWGSGILVLGFKQFGRAKDMEIPNLQEWRDYFKNMKIRERSVIGFDNLALEQLEIKNHLPPERWNSLWFGPEFSSSMYVDAVEETFAPTSRSTERTSWSTGITLVDYFNKYKNDFSN